MLTPSTTTPNLWKTQKLAPTNQPQTTAHPKCSWAKYIKCKTRGKNQSKKKNRKFFRKFHEISLKLEREWNGIKVKWKDGQLRNIPSNFTWFSALVDICASHRKVSSLSFLLNIFNMHFCFDTYHRRLSFPRGNHPRPQTTFIPNQRHWPWAEHHLF